MRMLGLLQPREGTFTLLADQDTPVKFSFQPSTHLPMVNFEFVGFRAGFNGLGIWDASGAAPDFDEYMNPETCTNSPSDLIPANKTVFIFHPSASFDIAGQVSEPRGQYVAATNDPSEQRMHECICRMWETSQATCCLRAWMCSARISRRR